MEGNKDEALRCIQIAKEAISSGNKSRALKINNYTRGGHISIDLVKIGLEGQNCKMDST